MARTIQNPYTVDFDKLKPLYERQKARVYNYSPEDFEVDLLTNKWRHKSWKTWMQGGNDYSATKQIIQKYIDECAKPYGTRDLSEFHLFHD